MSGTERSDRRTFLDNASNVRLHATVGTIQRDLALLLVEHCGLFRAVRQHDHREETDPNSGDAFDDEEQLPVRYRRLDVLRSDRDETAECACDGCEAEPRCHAQTDLLLGVEVG